ncbi:MAG: hypothetical protein AAGJ79_08590 [Verrucomicrobiota bacterium]
MLTRWAVVILVSAFSLCACKDPTTETRATDRPDKASAKAIAFEVASVERRLVEGEQEIQITGSLRNRAAGPLEIMESARLRIGGRSYRAAFLASNPPGIIPAGEEREVLLPFVVARDDKGSLILEIGDWKGELK